jgi:hypothetical protein
MSTVPGDSPSIPFWNYFDYVPVVSNFSGTVRGVFGTVEAVVGVVTLPFEVFGRTISSQSRPFILVDGIANVVRGTIAETPILGNIALYLYDHSVVLKRDFQQAAGILFV